METNPPYPPPAPQPSDHGLFGETMGTHSQRLYRTGVTLLAVALGALWFTAETNDSLQLFQGLTIFALSFLPSLRWARAGGNHFPVFEPILLLCANAYAIPLLRGHEQLEAFSSEVITRAGWTVILFQTGAILAHRATRGHAGRGSFWAESVLSPRVEKAVIHGIGLAALYTALATFTEVIPYDINSVLRAIFFGVGILCTFVAAQRWGRNLLSPSDKVLFVAYLLPHLVFNIVGLLLIQSLGLLAIALLGYVTGGKKVPWLLLALSFAIVAILHNGKESMRKKYWEEEYPPPTLAELPAFFSEWISHGLVLSDHPDSASDRASLSNKLLERSSLMHILCLVTAWTPERQPYLYGETYGYVLPQLIPRLFWPDKPRSHIGTYRLAIYYGLQSEESTYKTTIAFGLITEAYANFGMLGAVMLGVFWGAGLKRLQVLSEHSPPFSLGGLLMILLTAWSFNSEHTMAVWVSSLFQAMVVLLGLPLLLRRFFGL